jgi:glycosyltransferase involved in cell wall biosynthesis
MNVLVVHNRYRETGGEDRVVELESALLARHGHTVVPYILDNATIDAMNPLALAGRTVWNHEAYRAVRRLIRRECVDVVHVHNTVPLASPAVYYAANAEGVPVIQTLHNYRLLCSNALLVRDGKPCRTCVGAPVPAAAVAHACYRGSRAATSAVAGMLMLHRAAGTWQRQVDTYIATTGFARDLFVTGGLPADRLVVKPHFVDPDPGAGRGGGGYALYVGRLSREKGVETLLNAWARMGGRVPLRIVGDGPLASHVAEAAGEIPGVVWLGRRDRAAVQQLMADAAVLVLPSIAYETFGQVVIEAYAAGTPVIASSHGAVAELVDAGRTGVLVSPGDPDDLARRVCATYSDGSLPSMRAAARARYERHFTAGTNYESLLAIYRPALARGVAQRAGEPEWAREVAS